MTQAKKISHAAQVSLPPIPISEMVESIVGCKWSLHVLASIRSGIIRPGELARSAPGLTTKVLSERLAKLVRFGILQRRSFPQVPPRVEYAFTPFGERFLDIIDAVESLKRRVEQGELHWTPPGADDAGATPLDTID